MSLLATPAAATRFVRGGFTWTRHADGRETRGYRVDPARIVDGVYTDALRVSMPVIA